MQPVNDDMDNLFRQAADSYPLNTSGANFDKVRQQQADVETAMPDKKESKRNYLWLLLLLLLPLAFLLKQYKNSPTPQYSQTKNEIITQQDKNKIALTDGADTATETDKLQSKNDIKKATVTNATNKIKKKHPETKEKETQAANNTPANLTKYTTAKQPLSKDKRLVSRSKAKRQLATAPGIKERPYFADKEVVFPASGNRVKNKATSLLSADEYNKRTLAKLMSDANKNIAKQPDTSHKRLVPTTLQIQANNKKEDTATLTKKDSLANNTSRELANKRTETKTKPGVYIGIITGPDISAVKTKQVNGLGYNLGFITGYNTGRHLAFETGIIWNNKRYHAEGKNVSLDKLALPPHTQLLYSNGTCEMIEIPLNIRYHFSAKTANNLYIGAGVSSYIMKNEYYNYKSKWYNMEYYQKREYANTVNNWLSVLQLNAGYQINFKGRSSLRIEPYAKLPLKGIGIGKLPLTSTGLNVGYTMSIH